MKVKVYEKSTVYNIHSLQTRKYLRLKKLLYRTHKMQKRWKRFLVSHCPTH